MGLGCQNFFALHRVLLKFETPKSATHWTNTTWAVGGRAQVGNTKELWCWRDLLLFETSFSLFFLLQLNLSVPTLNVDIGYCLSFRSYCSFAPFSSLDFHLLFKLLILTFRDLNGLSNVLFLYAVMQTLHSTAPSLLVEVKITLSFPFSSLSLEWLSTWEVTLLWFLHSSIS